MHPSDGSNRPVSRRSILKAGGGVAAALAGVGIPLIGAGPAGATVPDSQRFVLGGTGGNPIWKKSLHANWVLQSFGYDSVNQHVYFLQHNSTNTDSLHFGDLWLTKTDLAGNELGAMALHGFGHGVSIGVEPYQGSVYLWTETVAAGSTNDNSYGTKMGRFEFQDGATLSKDDSRIADYTPTITDTVHNPQPTIDPSTNRLLVRYASTAGHRVVAFDLDNARAGNLADEDRLIERALPDTTYAFQGFTAYGRYGYILEGDASTSTTYARSYITTVDLNDVGSSVVESFETTAGQSLPAREPEGMGIWLAPEPRLCFGFESNTDGVRQASVFYKNQLT